MAFPPSSSSSSVRLFATASLLVMLLMASAETGIMADESPTPSPCMANIDGHCPLSGLDDCFTFCKSMGYTRGDCFGASHRNICTCTMPGPC